MTHPAIVKGRTAVITGAASGIGLAAAETLAGHGMAVALLDLPGPRLDAARERLAARGAEVRAIAADVADAAAIRRAADQVAAELPPVTVLMNNAGIGDASSALGHPEAWTRILGVNLWGVIHGTQAFAPQMIAHGETGVIVNTGSKQGITLPPGNPAYNVSKAAVKAYTESLSHELRTRPGCRISAHLLIPGWVFTAMTAAPGTPKPAGAWLPEQAVDFLLASLERGDFYILCPDNDVARPLDEKRIAWMAGDLIENRPALSRWHPDYADAFRRFLDEG